MKHKFTDISIFRTTEASSPDLYSKVHYHYHLGWVVNNFCTSMVISVEYVYDTDVDSEGYPYDVSNWEVRFSVHDRSLAFLIHFFSESEWVEKFGAYRNDIEVFEKKLSEVLGVDVDIR